jgi:hypothetical protein
MVGHAPSIAAKIASQIVFQTPSKVISPSRRPTRKSLFALIVDALHHSRRLQAKRTLRQYRHLIDRAGRPGRGQPHASSGDDRHVDE